MRGRASVFEVSGGIRDRGETCAFVRIHKLCSRSGMCGKIDIRRVFVWGVWGGVIKEAVVEGEAVSERNVEFSRATLNEGGGRPARAFVVAVHGIDCEYCSLR